MKKILVIDDLLENLVVIQNFLIDLIPDCKVFTAQSGLKGIEIAKTKQPDTILLDVKMPEMDGYEVCKQLKSSDITKHIPIILITAIQTISDSRIKGLEYGADVFITKPIDPSELTAQIKVMLRIKEAEDILRAEKKLLDKKVKDRTIELTKKNMKLQNKIIEHKRSEMALLESEEKFRDMANLLPQIVFETDVLGNITYTNREGFESFGYSIEDFDNGVNVFQMIIAEDKDKAVKNIQNVITGKKIENPEYTALRKNGSTFPILIYANPIIKDKETVGIRGIIVDITERHKNLLAIKDSKDRYQHLFEDAPISLFEEDFTELSNYFDVLKRNGINDFRNFFDENPDKLQFCFNKIMIVDINLMALKLNKAKSKKDLITNLHKTFTDRSYAVIKEEMIAIANGAIEFKSETEVITLSGEIRNILLKLSLKKLENGKIDYAHCLVATYDTTDCKKAEMAIIESGIRYRALFESAGDAFFLLKDGTFIDCNQKTLELFGCKRDDIIGHSPIDFSPPNQFDGKTSSQKASEKIRATMNGNPQFFEWQHKKLNGEIFEVEVSLNLVKLSSGPHIQAIVRDVTKRYQAEKELKQRLSELEIFNDASVDRELMINDLRKEINDLLKKSGEVEKYEIVT